MKKLPEINFVQNQQRQIKLRTNKKKITNFSFLAILLSYSIIFLLVLSYQAYLTIRSRSIQNNIDKETKLIEGLSPIENKVYLLKQKTTGILSIQEANFSHQDLIEEIFKLLPSELEVEQFDLSDDFAVNFGARTNNPMAVFEFIDRINRYNSNQNGKKIDLAVINGIKVDSSGFYSFKVDLKIVFVES